MTELYVKSLFQRAVHTHARTQRDADSSYLTKFECRHVEKYLIFQLHF